MSTLRAACALVLAVLASCGGGGDGGAGDRGPAKSGAKTAPSGKASAASDEVPPLTVERGMLRLLPEDARWFHEPRPKLRLAVDRHRSADQLVRDSFASKIRDSRRAVSLNVMKADTWVSPAVVIPESASLCFSYMPFIEQLGGLLGGVTSEVRFVQGKSAGVTVWRKEDVLRPPVGGTWREVSLDLSKVAGRTGRFEFRCAPHKDSPRLPSDLVVAFANPMVVERSAGRPNLVVISIDTLRRDALSPYAAGRQTPNVQRIADRGVVAEQFWSAAPWTLSSYASFFTGEYPSTHGAGLARGADAIENEQLHTVGIASGIPSLVEHLAQSGYLTQSFYANGHLGLGRGIERGFDGYLWYGSTGNALAEFFDQWLEGVEERPFFAFLQLVDPHWPYTVPLSFERGVEVPDTRDNPSFAGHPADMLVEGIPPDDREDMRAVYDVLVRYMDKQVGYVLDSLERRGLTGDTLVVFHSDHGEELWDHGEWWHGHTQFAELTHVPLLFSWPGHLPEGARVTQPIRGIDVLPTAIDLLGLPAPEHTTEGVSVAAWLRGEPGPKPRPALSEFQLYGPGGDMALVDWPYRLVVLPRTPWNSRAEMAEGGELPEGELVFLFDLSQDPTEQVNLASQQPDRVRAMRKEAEAIRRAASERRSGDQESSSFDDGDPAAMQGLGYTGTK